MQETHHHLLAPLQGEGADERDQQRQEAHRDLPREPEVVATGGPAVAAEAQQHLHAAPAGQGAGREEGEGEEGAAGEREGAGAAEAGPAAAVGEVEEQVAQVLILCILHRPSLLFKCRRQC